MLGETAETVSTFLLEFFNLITDYAERRRLSVTRLSARQEPDSGVRRVLASLFTFALPQAS